MRARHPTFLASVQLHQPNALAKWPGYLFEFEPRDRLDSEWLKVW